MLPETWPQRLDFLAASLSPTVIEGATQRTAMEGGNVRERKIQRDRDGFTGEAAFSEEEWQLFTAAMTGIWRMSVPGVGLCNVSVIGNDSRYAPVFLGELPTDKGPGARMVRFWLVKHGPAPDTGDDPRPDSSIAG